MAQGKAPTTRKSITLAESTIRYLEKLACKGTHGSTVTGVATTLVEEGVRLAIKEGFIKIEDGESEKN